AEYVINFSGVTDAKGNLLDDVTFAGVASGVIFENVKFMRGESEVKTLPLEATEIAISADVKNVANAEGNYEFILAVYNDGRLETILSTGAQKTTADGSSKPVYVNATGLSLTENHEIKAFFFEDLSNLSSLRVPEVLSPIQFQ
ncbi:MAG: hypothetical protein IKL09_02885, partial [Clostridia bacterium]|nr:hypothetical protein [Clostridia bacterium]